MATSDASSNKSRGKLVLGSPGPSRGSTSMALIVPRRARGVPDEIWKQLSSAPTAEQTFPLFLGNGKGALG
jgi:hypothetical protein